MFGIGGNELIIILLFGFLIFGPDKLPGMAKTIGRAIAKFRTAQEEMNNIIKNEVYDPDSDNPFSNPLDTMAKVEQKVTREDRGESFTERKARYDRQRAAKAAAASAGAGAANASDESANEASSNVYAKASEEATDNRPSADELYGVQPRTRKPQAKEAADTQQPAAEKPSVATEPVEHDLTEAADTPATPETDEGKGE